MTGSAELSAGCPARLVRAWATIVPTGSTATVGSLAARTSLRRRSHARLAGDRISQLLGYAAACGAQISHPGQFS